MIETLDGNIVDENQIRKVYEDHKCVFHEDQVKCIDNIKSVLTLTVSRVTKNEIALAEIKEQIKDNRKDIGVNTCNMDYLRKMITTIMLSTIGTAVSVILFLAWYIFEHH